MIIDELVALLSYKIDDKDELKKFNKGLEDIERKARAVGAAIRGAAVIAGAAVAGGFALLGRGVVNTSAKFEGYLTTLETIEGSAEKAKQSLAWVTEFAKTTPFDIDQATEAFVKLKAYGIDPLKDDTLKVIGDTASAMGKDLMQAVEAWADAMTGENERLKEFGVKAKKEGDKITYTWTEQGKEVKKTIKDERSEILKFLNETMGKKFGGAMERQSKTWKGMVSNLSDTWMNFQKSIGDAGFFDDLKNKLRELMSLFDSWQADGTAAKWAKILSNALTSISDAFAWVVRRVATHFKALSDNLATFAPYLKGLGIAIGLLLAVMFRWLTILTLLALALDDFFTYLEGGESAVGKFIEAFKKLLPFSDELNSTLANIGTGAIAALAAALLLAPMTALRGFGLAVRLALMASIAAAGLLGVGGWALILAGVGIGLMAAFWDEIKAAIASNQANAQAEFAQIKQWFLDIDWAGAGEQMMNSIWEGMKSVGESIKNWFASLIPDWAKGIIGGNAQPGTGSYAPGFTAPQGTPGPPTPRTPGVESSPTQPSGRTSLPGPQGAQGPQGQPGPPSPSREMVERAIQNAVQNVKKAGTPAAAANVVTNDHRQDNREYPVTVSAPVTVNVQQASQAPAQVGSAIAGAVAAGVKAQPSRMQSGPVE